MSDDHGFMRAVARQAASCPDDERIRDGFVKWLAEVDPDLPPEALDRITDESQIKFPGQKVGQYRDWLTETSYDFFKGGVMWQRQKHQCEE